MRTFHLPSHVFHHDGDEEGGDDDDGDIVHTFKTSFVQCDNLDYTQYSFPYLHLIL